jgi:hypothetical protein
VFKKCKEGYLDESRPAYISRFMTLHNDVYKLLTFSAGEVLYRKPKWPLSWTSRCVITLNIVTASQTKKSIKTATLKAEISIFTGSSA